MSTFGDIGRLWQEKYKTHFNFCKVFRICRNLQEHKDLPRKSTRTASELLLGLVRLG